MEQGPAGRGPDGRTDLDRAYNQVWWEYGSKVVGTKRTSLIVDPADGRIPPLTPEGQKRAEDKRGLWTANGEYQGRRQGSELRLPRRSAAAGAVSRLDGDRPADGAGRVQQQRAVCSRRAETVVIVNEMVHDRGSSRSMAVPSAAIRLWMGSLARPLGWRHARRRHHEFQGLDRCSEGGQREAAPHRTLQTRRCRTRCSIAFTVDDPGDVGETVDG